MPPDECGGTARRWSSAIVPTVIGVNSDGMPGLVIGTSPDQLPRRFRPIMLPTGWRRWRPPSALQLLYLRRIIYRRCRQGRQADVLRGHQVSDSKPIDRAEGVCP